MHGQDVLNLDEDQVAISKSVVAEHDNIPSATTPYIFKKTMEEPRIPVAHIAGLGFRPGLAWPGLTVTGLMLEKI